jgi:hypothetical protein
MPNYFKPVRLQPDSAGLLVLADIGRATATMCSMIADAPPTAANNEIAFGHIGQSHGWWWRCNTGHHHLRKRRLGLKGPDGLAIRASCGRERDYQH